LFTSILTEYSNMEVRLAQLRAQVLEMQATIVFLLKQQAAELPAIFSEFSWLSENELGVAFIPTPTKSKSFNESTTSTVLKEEAIVVQPEPKAETVVPGKSATRGNSPVGSTQVAKNSVFTERISNWNQKPSYVPTPHPVQKSTKSSSVAKTAPVAAKEEITFPIAPVTTSTTQQNRPIGSTQIVKSSALADKISKWNQPSSYVPSPAQKVVAKPIPARMPAPATSAPLMKPVAIESQSFSVSALRQQLLAPKQFVSSKRQDVAELDGVVCVKEKVDKINKQLEEIQARFQTAPVTLISNKPTVTVVESSQPKFSMMYTPEQTEIQRRGTFLNFWLELALAQSLTSQQDYDAAQNLLEVIYEKHRPDSDESCMFSWNTCMLCCMNNRLCVSPDENYQAWLEVRSRVLNVGLHTFKKFEMEFAYYTLFVNQQIPFLISLVESKSYSQASVALEDLISSITELKRIKGSFEIHYNCTAASVCFLLFKELNNSLYLDKGRALLEPIPVNLVPDNGIKVLGAIYFELARLCQTKQDFATMEQIVNLALNLPSADALTCKK
jgi:hypothetical protein